MDCEGLYWIDTGWACGGVVVKDDLIVDAAPIFKKFLKQPISNLLKWKAVKRWRLID